MWKQVWTGFLLSVFALAAAGCGTLAATSEGNRTLSYLDRLPQDEVIYFVIPDRFENGDPQNDTGFISGGRLQHGFDPAHKGFYHGGDLKGLTARLDYIQGLGATAIWLGPIYQNKAVQGPSGLESAGYHGYWITDFMTPDRHLGSEADMKAFVEAVHARNMKIYLDIITNHTADVIQYRECADPNWRGERVPPNTCPYRGIGNYPFTRRADAPGETINSGFMGLNPPFQTRENFAKLTDFTFAYHPYIPPGEERTKSPAWLNDIRYYHNRGDTLFDGESSTYGDFAGLDDLMTEDPAVVDGFIDIYKSWITKYRIDGFRIDTAKHVNPEFWQAFNPAMIKHARSIGIPNFTVFGEAMHENDSAWVARYTHEGAFPAMLDFGFQGAVEDVLVDGKPTSVFDRLLAMDALYKDDAALRSHTFIGSHDIGRFAGFLRQRHPNMGEDEMLKRVELANAMMILSRGAPVLYYGDEQGFVSDGNDQLAREDMMPSRVAVYNDNDLIGTAKTTADSNFDTSHPLYRAIADLADLRQQHALLRRGEQTLRYSELDGGLFAFSRSDNVQGEVLIVMNMRNAPRKLKLATDARTTKLTTLRGACPLRGEAAGTFAFDLPALGYAVCKSNDWKAN